MHAPARASSVRLMLIRPRRTRATTAFALCLGLALAGPACDKGGTTPPGGDGAAEGGDSTAESAEGGADYVYNPAGFKLLATTKIKLDISSGQGQGSAEVQAKSNIEATPEGDKFKVHGQVAELIGYTGSGQLDPEFMKKQAEEAGEEPVDMQTELGKSEAWSIVDNKGENDDDATEALAENQDQEGAPMDFGLFNLPNLPSVDLEEGKKVQLPTEADEQQLPFGTIPVEVDVTWTLRGMDGDVAELDVLVESSGATEIDGGGATVLVSVLGESAYTVYFDMANKVPVSFNGYSASEISIDLPDGTQQIATNNEVETTFEIVQ